MHNFFSLAHGQPLLILTGGLEGKGMTSQMLDHFLDQETAVVYFFTLCMACKGF